VVLAIVGILASLAVTDLSSLIGRYRLNSATRELARTILDCRMQAISENRECAVKFVNADTNLQGDWTQNAGRVEVSVAEVSGTGVVWALQRDGVTDYAAGPGRRRGVSIEPWTPIAGPVGSNQPDTVVFNPRGFSSNAPADFANGGVVRIILRNKRATTVEQRVLRIDRGGNVQIAVP